MRSSYKNELNEEKGRDESKSETANKRFTPEHNENQDSNWIYIVIYSICGLSLIISGIALGYWYLTPNCSSFSSVKTSFNRQSKDLWKKVQASIEDQRIQVKTLVLLHDVDAAKTAACLATQVADAFLCKRSNLPLNVSTLTARELNTVGFGSFLDTRRQSLGHAVIVKNLNEINSENAQVFHTLCDEITPYKNPALYVFTLPISTEVNQPAMLAARLILEKNWGDLANNILDPLVNRILGYVSFIKKEEVTPCSSS